MGKKPKRAAGASLFAEDAKTGPAAAMAAVEQAQLMRAHFGGDSRLCKGVCGGDDVTEITEFSADCTEATMYHNQDGTIAPRPAEALPWLADDVDQSPQMLIQTLREEVQRRLRAARDQITGREGLKKVASTIKYFIEQVQKIPVPKDYLTSCNMEISHILHGCFELLALCQCDKKDALYDYRRQCHSEGVHLYCFVRRTGATPNSQLRALQKKGLSAFHTEDFYSKKFVFWSDRQKELRASAEAAGSAAQMLCVEETESRDGCRLDVDGQWKAFVTYLDQYGQKGIEQWNAREQRWKEDGTRGLREEFTKEQWFRAECVFNEHSRPSPPEHGVSVGELMRAEATLRQCKCTRHNVQDADVHAAVCRLLSRLEEAGHTSDHEEALWAKQKLMQWCDREKQRRIEAGEIVEAAAGSSPRGSTRVDLMAFAKPARKQRKGR